MKAAIIPRMVLCALCVTAVGGLGSRSNAQGPGAQAPGPQTPGVKGAGASSKPAPKPEATAADDLSLRQDRLASRYAELEKLLLKMAEFEGPTNPRRSALLKQAATQSSEQLTKAKLVQIAKLLNGQQLKRAIDSQTEVQADIKLLLTLLQSENENANRKSEQDKIKEFIKEFKRMGRMQSSLRARTEQSEDPKSLSKEQSGLADQAEKLKQEIAEHEGTSAPEEAPSEGSEEGSEKKKGDDLEKPKPEASDKNPDQKNPKSETPSDEQKGAEPSKGEEKSPPKQGDEKTPPSQSPPSEGEQKSDPSKEDKPGQGGKESPMPSEEGAQEAPPPEEGDEKQEGEQQKSPVQKRMEAAQKRMQEAKKRLEEAKRDEAVKEQQKAEEELKKAVAELEEILKQLREEEIEQTLADLATRFRKMLEMQLKVNESTLQLAKIPADKRGREVDLQSTRLSADEQKIMHEAEKALTLLGDEGSSTAFPATVEQLVQDMQQIVERLATVKIDSITVGIQEETVETLEQLIAALEQEQKEREKKKQEEQESPAPEQQPGEDPLIDRIAELKMIKSLQVKINQRTQRFSKLLTDPNDPVGQANSADLESAILQLSKRQADVFRVTRDIVVGRKK